VAEREVATAGVPATEVARSGCLAVWDGNDRLAGRWAAMAENQRARRRAISYRPGRIRARFSAGNDPDPGCIGEILRSLPDQQGRARGVDDVAGAHSAIAIKDPVVLCRKRRGVKLPGYADVLARR